MLRVLDGSMTFSPGAVFRASWRAIAVMFCSVCALIEIGITIWFVPRNRRIDARAKWLHRWCSVGCNLLNIQLNVHGSMPRTGLLVCNHLSYLDIIALSAAGPCVFVAKRDVAAWPIFGWLARLGGTIFVNRDRRQATPGVVEQMRKGIAAGSLIVLFPEGTSSDGSSVLPFKSALLEPAFDSNCQVTVGAIDYSLSDGSVADEICYWRDMTFVPHLLNLFGKRGVKATLRLVAFCLPTDNRKELARELRCEINGLRS